MNSSQLINNPVQITSPQLINNPVQITSPQLINFTSHTIINVSDIPDEKPSICSYMCIIFISLIWVAILSVYIILDLYFAYNSQSCQSNPNNGFPFTLNTWLKVDGYTYIAGCVFVIINTFTTKNEVLNILIGVCIKIFSWFIGAWTIVGAIMFWKYLDTSNTCHSDINNYMYVRLISGIIAIASMLFKSSKD
jgi:hypothetical protein